VYDIHSPRVPSTAEIVQALKRMQEVLGDRQIWVNPDCGLKDARLGGDAARRSATWYRRRGQMRPVPRRRGGKLSFDHERRGPHYRRADRQRPLAVFS